MFESISVRELYTDITEISWTLKSGIDLSKVVLFVERSESYSGPFETISEPLTLSVSGFSFSSYLDTKIDNLNRHRTLYYRIRGVNWETEETIDYSGVEYNRFDRDLVAMEIARRNNLLLRRFVGIPAFAFIAKTYGSKCSCWDVVKMRKTRSDCDECYNTGYSGGFMTPIPMFLSDEVDTKAVQITDFGELQPKDGAGWTGHFPILKPRDVIITYEDRYRVVSCKPVRHKKSVVMQILNLTSLNRSDVEWKLERPEFTNFTEHDTIVRMYGGSSGAYYTESHEKAQEEYSGYDPTTETGTLKADGPDFDQEIGA